MTGAGAAAGAGVGKWAGITSAIMHYPLEVVDRVISAGRLCVALRLVDVAGEVLAEALHTLRHTANTATDVANTAGDTLKWTIGMDAAARLTAFLATSTRAVAYLPF